MLRKHITDFLTYCKATDFAPKSLQSLRSNLKDFATFVDRQHIDAVKEIDYGLLSGFVANFKAPSIHKKKARVWSLHQFFHFLTLADIIRKNIALSLPYPKIEKTVPHYLTIQEFNCILEHLMLNVEVNNGMRDFVLILMLGLLGLRTATVVGLDVEHIDTEAGFAWITEKGRRQRQLVLPKSLNIFLRIYITEHHPGAGPLFLSIRKKRLSSRVLQKIFRALVDELGINKRLHAHLFRHTAATHLNKIAGTAITQAVLGHERRYNTLKYAHLNPDKYAQYMRRHPFMQEVLS